MQIDAEAAAAIGIASSVFSSVFAAGIAYGIMKTKLNRMELDNLETRSDLKKLHEVYVTHQHFNAVMRPISDTLSAVQKDIKDLLKLVSGRKV